MRKGYDYRLCREYHSPVNVKRILKQWVSYQDIEYSDCQNLVIQLDSIIHVDLEKVGNTILFLGLFRALVFLIHVHFCLPGAQIAFALIENHMKFH